MTTLSLNHLEILAAAIERYKAQRDDRMLAEQRMQAAFGATVDVKPEDVQVVASLSLEAGA